MHRQETIDQFGGPVQPVDDVVALEIGEGIARIRFHRPAALNAIDECLAERFHNVCKEVAARDDVRVVVLTGAGKGFMAGGDVTRMCAANPHAEKVIKPLLDALHSAILCLTELAAPVLASLHGAVAGAGASIAFAADLAIAADDTKINLAYAGIGATPDAGATWTLPRLVGLRRAVEIAMLSRTYDAEEALQLGLVNRVVPRAHLIQETDALARRVASGPTQAYGHIKKLMRQSFDRTLELQMKAERDAFVASTRTADFIEGTNAFVEKRAPHFIGR